MRTRIIGTWLLAAALIGGAFLAGMQLRAHPVDLATPSPIDGDTSVQASALLKLTPEWTPVNLADAPQGDNEQKALITSVLKLLKAHYVEPITGERETVMARGAVRGMIDSLKDPDSQFLDSDERKLLDDAGAGKFHGIGAVLALRKEKQGDLETTKVVVVAPMPGSPAEKAGLKPGDSVTYINSKWVVTHDPFKEAKYQQLVKAARNKEIDEFTYQKEYEATFKRLKDGMTISEALEALSSTSSGEVSLRVERANRSEPIELKLECRDTQVDPVSSRTLKHDIAYIRVTQFNKRAIEEFAVEFERIKTANAKGLILDLRANPGGLMDAATDITSKITGGGIIAHIDENSGQRTIVKTRTRKPGLTVIVLVDGGTSSVAELVAGTLRENASAILVGTKTFGDGLMQTPLILRDGSAAIVTTGKMLTAKGVSFDGKGLAPDKEVAQDHADAQLDAAESILLAKIGKT